MFGFPFFDNTSPTEYVNVFGTLERMYTLIESGVKAKMIKEQSKQIKE